MADKTENIKTRLSFDGEAQYKAACKEINSTLKVLNSEMKLVTAEYKDNANSAEALRAKQNVLQKTYDEQAKKVKETEVALERCRKATGDSSEESKKLETQLNYQKAALVKTEQELGKTANELENAGKAADSMGKEIEDSGKQAEDAEGRFNKLKSVMSGIGSAVATGVAALGTAALSAATGLAALTVSGSNYADDILTISANTGIATDSLQKYQYALNFIDGDIDTLTKTMEKQKQQMGNAAEGNKIAQAAYDRLGISVQNADGSFRDSEEVYWEVIDALGKVTDEVERDNLATDLLGKSSKDLRTVIEAGSEAFKAYGEEAENMGAVMSGDNLNALGSFNDKIQQLKAGMGGLKNAAAMIALPFLDTLASDGVSILSDFTTGIQNANGNMGEMASVVGNTLSKAVGMIAEKLPEFVNMGVSMITSLVEGLGQNLPTITSAAVQIITTLVQGIIQLLPQLIEGAVQIIAQLATGLAEALPQLVPQLVELMLFIVETLVNNIPLLIDAALQLITGLAQGLIDAIPVIIEKLPQIITAIINALIEGIPLIIESAGEIMIALIDGLITAIPLLIEAIPQIITAIVEGLITGLPLILETVGTMVIDVVAKFGELVTQIPPVIGEAITRLVEWGTQMQEQAATAMTALLNKVVTTLKELPAKIWNTIITCVTKIAEWGVKMQEKAKSAIANVVTSIVNGFTSLPSKMAEIGTNIVQGIWNGINNAKDWILDKIKGFGDAVLDGLKSFFGIASPSKLMRDQVGVFLAQGIGVGFEKEMRNVSRTMQNSIPREFDVDSKVNVHGSSRTHTDGDQQGDTPAGGVVVNQYIYANETSYAKQQKEAAKQMRLVVRTV